MPRFVFVTGGVVSSLGKGITAASLGAILEARGLKVSMIKQDSLPGSIRRKRKRAAWNNKALANMLKLTT